MKFSDAIRKARLEAGYNQERLAALLGWKQSRISNYERGIREPKQSDLELISSALGHDKSYVMRLVTARNKTVTMEATNNYDTAASKLSPIANSLIDHITREALSGKLTDADLAALQAITLRLVRN